MSENQEKVDDGPLARQVKLNWGSIWEAHKKGEVTTFYEEMTNQLIIDAENRIGRNDLTARNDLESAKMTHMAQKKHFVDFIARRDFYLNRLVTIEERLISSAQITNRFVSRTLCLANGGGALAAISFIGSKSGEHEASAMIPVAVLCFIGFSLSLLSGHIAILLLEPAVSHLITATSPWLKPSDREAEIAHFTRKLKRQRLARFIGYVAYLCLALAVVYGAIALAQYPGS